MDAQDVCLAFVKMHALLLCPTVLILIKCYGLVGRVVAEQLLHCTNSVQRLTLSESNISKAVTLLQQTAVWGVKRR